MKWAMNAAGDWETIHNGARYRAEQMGDQYWLSRRSVDLSAYGELMGRFDDLAECEAHISQNATNEQ